MISYNQLVSVFLPYLIFIIFIFCAGLLYHWAKKRKAAAIGIGMLMHIIMPVPNVEKVIELVVAEKKLKEQQQKQTDESDN